MPVVKAYQFDVSVRPYTLRKGDTMQTIAEKRGLTLLEVTNINIGMDPAKIKEGATILLPSGNLSSRDREILQGIGTTYRVYPVRRGESLNDIISKRSIERVEVQGLNPGVNLDKLKENQLLRLPANRFTVREREMLIGSGILPREFFSVVKSPFAIGLGALMLVCGFVMAWQRGFDEDSVDAAEEELAA